MDPLSPFNIPACGKPMYVGYLFDGRNVELLQVSPWSDEELKNGTQIQPLRHTSIEFFWNDSRKERIRALGINIKMEPFLSGFIDESGAAKLFYADEKEENTFRVMVHIKLTCFSKNLKPSMLNNMPNSKVLDQATHLITGGVYGGQCFFVFDRVYEEEEEILEVQAKMKSTLLFFFEDKVGVYAKETYIEEAEKINIFFYGDIDVEVNTLEECVKVYKNLDQHLGRSGQRAVPLTTNLIPLVNLIPEKGGWFH